MWGWFATATRGGRAASCRNGILSIPAKWSSSALRVMKKKLRISKSKAVTATTLDALHDSGVDLSSHVDLTQASRPGRIMQRVNVDFPVDLLREIDRQARRLGVTRQAFIKIRIADSLQLP